MWSNIYGALDRRSIASTSVTRPARFCRADAASTSDRRGRDGKRATESTVAPELAPEEGFEPPTRRLTAACSTTELLRISACVADANFETYNKPTHGPQTVNIR